MADLLVAKRPSGLGQKQSSEIVSPERPIRAVWRSLGYDSHRTPASASGALVTGPGGNSNFQSGRATISSQATQVRSIIAAASLLAQAAFFVGIYFLAADLLSLSNVIAPDRPSEPGLLASYARETITSYQAVLWAGVSGAIVFFGIYLKNALRAHWFLAGARVLGWMWFLLIPVSTLVGVVLIS